MPPSVMDQQQRSPSSCEQRSIVVPMPILVLPSSSPFTTTRRQLRQKSTASVVHFDEETYPPRVRVFEKVSHDDMDNVWYNAVELKAFRDEAKYLSAEYNTAVIAASLLSSSSSHGHEGRRQQPQQQQQQPSYPSNTISSPPHRPEYHGFERFAKSRKLHKLLCIKFVVQLQDIITTATTTPAPSLFAIHEDECYNFWKIVQLGSAFSATVAYVQAKHDYSQSYHASEQHLQQLSIEGGKTTMMLHHPPPIAGSRLRPPHVSEMIPPSFPVTVSRALIEKQRVRQRLQHYTTQKEAAVRRLYSNNFNTMTLTTTKNKKNNNGGRDNTIPHHYPQLQQGQGGRVKRQRLYY